MEGNITAMLKLGVALLWLALAFVLYLKAGKWATRRGYEMPDSFGYSAVVAFALVTFLLYKILNGFGIF